MNATFQPAVSIKLSDIFKGVSNLGACMQYADAVEPEQIFASDNPLLASAAKAVSKANSAGSVRFPVTTDKGAPKQVEANTAAVLDHKQITARYNVLSKDVEVNIPGHQGTTDNHHEVCFSKSLDACHEAGYSIGVDTFKRHLLSIADSNAYNPFALWVTSKPWDGINRVDQFYDSIKTGCKSEFKQKGMLRFAMGMLAAAFKPEGISGGGITVVFVGAQGVGKSYWCSHLMPKQHGWFKDGAVNPDDKDSVSQALSYLLFELGELDGVFRKSDTAKLKAFLSRDFDRFRRPYAAMDSRYARRTMFIASVNHHEFLVDETGNRRYWPLDVVSMTQLPDNDAWKQQLWAELYETRFQRGERWNLSRDEIAELNTHNQAFTTVDPIEDRLRSRFDFSKPHGDWKDWKTATQICEEAGIKDDTRATKLIASIIRREWGTAPETGQDCAKRSGGKRLLLVPPIARN